MIYSHNRILSLHRQTQKALAIIFYGYKNIKSRGTDGSRHGAKQKG